MNQIFYFKNGNSFVAIAPNQFSEFVTFYQLPRAQFALFASIKFESSPVLDLSYYEAIDSGYQIIERAEYLQVRYAAQCATAEFFGEFERFQTPAFDPELMQGFLVK